MAKHEHVVARLKELRDWADYIRESLAVDQSWETGKVKLMESLFGPEAVEDVREEARALAERLEKLLERAESKVLV